jgi:LTXXQ motif family protein
MNRSLFAGAALLAGFVVAAPTLVWSADPEPQSQTAPSPAAQQGMGMMGMMGSMGMTGMHQEMGPMARGGMRDMMMRMGQLPSRQRCEERLARRAGVIAYTVAKLNLTAEQKPLWERLSGIVQSATDRERQLCVLLPTSAEQRGQQTILDRVDRAEQFLSARVQALQQAKPALDALYQSLSPDQRAIINHPFGH